MAEISLTDCHYLVQCWLKSMPRYHTELNTIHNLTKVQISMYNLCNAIVITSSGRFVQGLPLQIRKWHRMHDARWVDSHLLQGAIYRRGVLCYTRQFWVLHRRVERTENRGREQGLTNSDCSRSRTFHTVVIVCFDQYIIPWKISSYLWNSRTVNKMPIS